MKLRNVIIFIGIQVLIALVLSVNIGVVSAKDVVPNPQCKTWKSVPLTPDKVEIVYDGMGQVLYDNGLQLKPRSIASESGTHAALSVLKNIKLQSNFGIRIKYANTKGLRTPSSNTWEVFWLMFNYRNVSGNKETNYFIFKPNGVELGKAWDKTAQEFLKTSNAPFADWGQEYELQLFRDKNNVQALINGKSVLNFTADNKHQLFSEGDSLGLYTEDAEVHIKSLDVCEN